MTFFSERYGYINPSEVIIREQITQDIQNGILNCYDQLCTVIHKRGREANTEDPIKDIYSLMEKSIWVYFLNQRESEYIPNQPVIADCIVSPDIKWYKKLDMIEYSIAFLIKEAAYMGDFYFALDIAKALVKVLNEEFERLNFAYRIINNRIVELTAEEEITAIEKALNDSQDNIKIHLNNALELYGKKPTGDYRNSIKESISAVEAMSRNITGDNVLNFKKMEDKGVIIPPVLRQAFEKLYGYTNDKTTGIRHALMDDTNAPQAEEALFMLVSCSAFINYLNKKV